MLRGHRDDRRWWTLLPIAGWLAVACGGPAWGGPAIGEEETAYLKQRTFLIPIEVAAEEGSSIQELRLFVSSDRGATWTQVAKVSPNKRDFRFKAVADGEYWFSLALVDQAGNVDPPDPKMQEPGLKVVVDTSSPLIQLKSLERSADGAGVTWKILDNQAVDLGSLRVEIRDKREAQWRELRPDAALEGEIRWPADVGQSFFVRATVEDRAGNVGHGEMEIIGASTSNVAPVSATTTSLPPASVPGGALSETGFQVPAAPSTNVVGMEPKPIPKAPYEEATSTRPAVSNPPTRVETVATVSEVVPFDRMRPDLPADGEPAPRAATLEGNVTPIGSAARPIYEQKAIATTATSVRQASHTVRKEPAESKPAAPKVPLIGTTRFAVDYALRGVGPAGVGKVELYTTKDNGALWTLYGEDPDRAPPFEVDLPGEGRYGLAVVVTSPAGHGMKPPQSGDAPKILVEVDTTAPEAELYRPVPDPQTNGETLLVSWSARDAHLADHPVGLFFAEAATGPWYRIAVDLPASGQYSWRVPPRTPHQVYLKLMVIDQCSNVAEATTPEPVLVDLSKPEADVIGIAILPGEGRK